MAFFSVPEKMTGGSLTLKVGLPALIATIIAVSISAAFFFRGYLQVESLTDEARLHDEAMISLAGMNNAALELRHSSHQIVNNGEPSHISAFSNLRERIQYAHNQSVSKHEAAEAGRPDAENKAHNDLDDLYYECEQIHLGLGSTVQELIDNGAIVPGIGAQGVDRARLLNELDAQFDEMAVVDQSIEALLEEDREATLEDLDAAQRNATQVALLAVVIALVSGFSIAYVSSKKIARPVKQMVKAVASMAEGDMSQHVDVDGNDELSRLGTTFNSMAGALQQRTEQLEHEKASIRSIHQSIGDGIVVFNNAGRIVSLNPAAENALGKNALDLEGMSDIGVSRLQRELEQPPIAWGEMSKCWEVKNCTHPECPSYQSSDRRCWLQCGTCCHNQIQGTFRQKRDACERCDVFQANAVRNFEVTIEGKRFSCNIIPVLDDDGQQEGRCLVFHDITDIHRAKKELERRSEELEKLQELTNAVTGRLDLMATLEAGVTKVADTGSFDAVAIYLYDDETQQLKLTSAAGVNMSKLKDAATLEQDTVPAQAFSSGSPAIVEDLRKFKRAPASLRKSGILSAAVIPLTKPDSTLMGILCAGKKRVNAFGENDTQLLQLMAAQVSIAASNSMLYEESVLYSEKMLARNRIVSTLTSSLVFEEMFEAFATETGKLAKYDRMSVVLLDEEAAGIKRIITHGGCPMNSGGDYPFAGSVVEWIAEHKQPVKCDDLSDEARFSWDGLLVSAGIHSSANLPLIVENRVIGTLNFCSNEKNSFNEEIIAELQPIADQLALAIANQELFQRIARAKTEWEATFDAVGEGIVVVNENHVMVRLNTAAAEMLGGTVEGLTGESCRERLHRMLTKGDGPCVLADAVPGKDSLRSEVELEDGRTLEIVIDAIFNTDGNFTGGVHFLRDITESNQMRQRLMTSEKMVAVGQLVSGVAHEINNPLTGITGYAQLLMMRDDLDKKTRNDAEAIATEADRATRIVRQLLSFARKHQPERQPVAINDIVRDSIGLKGYDLKVNNVRIQTSLSEDVPDVAVDRHQIQQVFINLITNAEQAIHEEDKVGSLKIESLVKSDKVQISFTDNGPGIPEDAYRRIFDPFFTTKEVGKGTGLGLSVCYGIIQEHMGNIWAEDAPGGKGARFVVELPIAVSSSGPETRSEVEVDTRTGMILLVDDEESVREVLAESLRRVGHQVDIAENGEVALRMIGSKNYDCVISDVKMPVMNGAELHLAVKSVNEDTAELFIFISGDTVNKETHEYLESVSNPSLTKPFSLQELEAALQEMLNGGRKAA